MLTANATAGSAAQLPWVEAEFKMVPVKSETQKNLAKPSKTADKPSCKTDPDTHEGTDSARPGKSKAALMPFSVNLVCLTQDQINLYTKPRPATSPVTLLNQKLER